MQPPPRPDISPTTAAQLGIDARLVDADQRVCVDVPCDACGYNLRTLQATGTCPECGAAVLDSIRSDDLRYAPANWVRRLGWGATLLAVAFGLLALVPLVGLLPLA